MCAILCIDDDPINALIMRKLLQDSYALEVVYTAEAGLKALETKRYEMILMDINLNEEAINGITLMQMIKKRFDKLKVIAVTANTLPGDERNFIEIGFDAYIAKPIDEKNLIETLKKTLS